MDHRIRSALRRIQRRFDRRLSVSDLAGGVNLSPSRFAHLFRAEAGMPPGRYLKEVRLRAALLLLETSFLSVKEVMARVGLSDTSHFVRDFKRHHGLRPGQARKVATRSDRPQQEWPTDGTIRQ